VSVGHPGHVEQHGAERGRLDRCPLVGRRAVVGRLHVLHRAAAWRRICECAADGARSHIGPRAVRRSAGGV